MTKSDLINVVSAQTEETKKVVENVINATLEALADALCNEYEVERETALADVDEFIAKLTKAGCIE